MNQASQNSIDVWNEFAAAVTYLAEVEQPALNIWDALAEALGAWLDDGSIMRANDLDPLRTVLVHLSHSTPEAGAPGGTHLSAILDAAMSTWATEASHRTNDNQPFL